MEPLIYVTRLDGSQLVVNADLIETVEHTAGTVITLVDGKRLVVATPVDDVVDSVVAFRQRISRGPLPIDEAAAGDPPAAGAVVDLAPRPFRLSALERRES